jgi:hypothetical protein
MIVKLLFDGRNIKVLHQSEDATIEYSHGQLNIDTGNWSWTFTAVPGPGQILVYKTDKIDLQIIGVYRL